jgi:hypothetical protein
VLIAFNSDAQEPKDDIGIIASLSAVLSAVFKAPADVFRSIPKNPNRVVVARKPRRQSDGGG